MKFLVHTTLTPMTLSLRLTHLSRAGARGGGDGVRDIGKLATSRVTLKERIDPNVWSGDSRCPKDGTRPLLWNLNNILDHYTFIHN
jgi:hypothetical protein